MAATLPLELLHIIGDRLRQEGVPLDPCTTVSRWWKDVFEAYIYIRVVVRSTKAELEAPLPGIPVNVFKSLASQDGNPRHCHQWHTNFPRYLE